MQLCYSGGDLQQAPPTELVRMTPARSSGLGLNLLTTLVKTCSTRERTMRGPLSKTKPAAKDSNAPA